MHSHFIGFSYWFSHINECIHPGHAPALSPLTAVFFLLFYLCPSFHASLLPSRRRHCRYPVHIAVLFVRFGCVAYFMVVCWLKRKCMSAAWVACLSACSSSFSDARLLLPLAWLPDCRSNCLAVCQLRAPPAVCYFGGVGWLYVFYFCCFCFCLFYMMWQLTISANEIALALLLKLTWNI